MLTKVINHTAFVGGCSVIVTVGAINALIVTSWVYPASFAPAFLEAALLWVIS